MLVQVTEVVEVTKDTCFMVAVVVYCRDCRTVSVPVGVRIRDVCVSVSVIELIGNGTVVKSVGLSIVLVGWVTVRMY